MNKGVGYIALIVVLSIFLGFNAFRILDVDSVGIFITIIGLVYGLLAAFTINNAWERFSKLRDLIAEETSSLQNAHIFLSRCSDKKTLGLFTNAVVEYCSAVKVTEWKAYWEDTKTTKIFEDVLRIVVDMKHRNDPQLVMYDKCLDEIREASTSRTSQLVLSRNRLPKVQWILIIFLSAILVFCVSFLAMPLSYSTAFMTSVMVASVLLILLIVYDLDSLKVAEQEVSEDPYQKLILYLKASP